MGTVSTFKELCEAALAGKTIQYESRFGVWVNLNDTPEHVIAHILAHTCVYRVAPIIKVIAYRVYLDKNHTVQVWRNTARQVELEHAPVFIRWLGDDQTVEVEL